MGLVKDLGQVYGKTISEFKNLITTELLQLKTHISTLTLMASADINDLVNNWNNNDHIISGEENKRSRFQMTSIGSISTSQSYAVFIISSYYLTHMYCVTLSAGVFKPIKRLVFADNIPLATGTTVGGIKSGGDISVASDGAVSVTKFTGTVITDPNTNWDTLINNAVYYIELTADSSESSHPPFSGANWGMLEVFGQNGKTILYQRFTVSTTGLVYLRAKTAIGWNAWKLVAQPIS